MALADLLFTPYRPYSEFSDDVAWINFLRDNYGQWVKPLAEMKAKTQYLKSQHPDPIVLKDKRFLKKKRRHK